MNLQKQNQGNVIQIVKKMFKFFNMNRFNWLTLWILLKVLRVNYCDLPLSVVVHRHIYVNVSSEITHWKLDRNDPLVVPIKVVSVGCKSRSQGKEKVFIMQVMPLGIKVDPTLIVTKLFCLVAYVGHRVKIYMCRLSKLRGNGEIWALPKLLKWSLLVARNNFRNYAPSMKWVLSDTFVNFCSSGKAVSGSTWHFPLVSNHGPSCFISCLLLLW